LGSIYIKQAHVKSGYQPLRIFLGWIQFQDTQSELIISMPLYEPADEDPGPEGLERRFRGLFDTLFTDSRDPTKPERIYKASP
jgi:hypothetical protein